MSQISFAKQVKDSRKIIYEVTARDKSGKNAWYKIEIFPDKKIEFEKILKTGSLKLDEYGKIIESKYID